MRIPVPTKIKRTCPELLAVTPHERELVASSFVLSALWNAKDGRGARSFESADALVVDGVYTNTIQFQIATGDEFEMTITRKAS